MIGLGIAAWFGFCGLVIWFVKRASKALVTTPPMPEPECAHDHDIWGCDTCEQQAVEQSMARHPSACKAREVAELESWWAAS